MMGFSPLTTLVLLLTATSSSIQGSKQMPRVLRTPEHRFANLARVGYPWKPNYIWMSITGVEKPLRIHYIDEGPQDAASETLLLAHGTPAWSFLFRKMIPRFLAKGYRVVAMDHIGFGRSDKLTETEDYSHQLHVSTLMYLVGSLDLKGVTLVAHDLGGPTGLSSVAREPWRYKRLVLLNTWIPQGDVYDSPFRFFQYLPYLSWRILSSILDRNLPVQTTFSIASSATKEAAKAYEAPFPSSAYLAGPAFWPQMIPLTRDDPVARDMQSVAHFLRGWHGPSFVAYSDREVFTLPGRDDFARALPGACTTTVRNAGHFLQEDQGPVVAELIIHFIEYGC